MTLFTSLHQEFLHRHIGPDEQETNEMLRSVNVSNLDELMDKTIPPTIRLDKDLNLPPAINEAEYINLIKEISLANHPGKTYIGQGYYDTHTPSVILRNVFENPGWYTQYTPYQAEISQGRLESLLNFQTIVSDLTSLPIANASLLDEATAAAEAMAMFFNFLNKSHENISRSKLFVDVEIFPQTIDVLMTRAKPLGIEIVIDNFQNAQLDKNYFGAILQYPNDKGAVIDYHQFIEEAHLVGAFVGMATDLLALTLLTPPGELGADAAFGSSQRFGVPLGFGGPHAAFFATKEEFKRHLPGRIIGLSIDAQGNRALRMALQTREQHIKRERATSNICTAQALLANMTAMYAVYHGAEGLKNIAKRVNILTEALAFALLENGHELLSISFFDTLVVKTNNSAAIRTKAEAQNINFRYFKNDTLIGISLDETTTITDVADIINVLNLVEGAVSFEANEDSLLKNIPSELIRSSDFLRQEVFCNYHSETKMMRYIKSLENKDLSLNTSMISLGSCTMKLNAATEMIPLSWNHWAKVHPFVPARLAGGYLTIIKELEQYLSVITGFAACSLQPNSGASGEFAGLLSIKRYHESKGDHHRNIVLIPISAHGTNPASAVMAGYKVIVIKALENGNIDIADLKAKAEKYAESLAGIMITYPSTYGIYEESVRDIIHIIHENGGQVYMDGANMNAQVGFTAPGFIGADVCHLNLHKTFAIPHGGGGPGMGPICVAEHLIPFLPGHFFNNGNEEGAVSAAPFGSASILLISYAYIRLLGAEGVKKATQYAILNANYMKSRLEKDFSILYSGAYGTCAHEFILDLRPFKKTAHIEAEDVAKRLMDYGFHAPTMSFPVPGTFMIEPTESEDKKELDRFCDALLSIREEIKAIETGDMDALNNPLKNAPHTQLTVINEEWDKPYSRELAAFPKAFVKENKFWPAIGRVNNSIGDRNLICTCEPTEAYLEVEN